MTRITTQYSLAVAAMLVLAGCGSDNSGPGGPGGPDDGGRSSGITPGLALSAPVSAAGAATTVVYVATSPGTVRRAASAEISTNGTLVQKVAAVQGGFDPVSIPGVAGDQVTVTITDSAGAKVVTNGMVKQGARPRVVRISPPPRKTDVPLNARMRVVFTTPMDPGSVASGVTLQAGGVRVPGAVLLSPDALAADFIPTSLLEADSDYELRVAGSVQDVLGTALGEPVIVEFRTGSTASASGLVEIYTTTFPWRGILTVGESMQLQAQFTTAGGTPDAYDPFVWTSSDPSVLEDVYPDQRARSATVVRAVRVGRATVRAEFQGTVGEMVVDVVPPASLRLAISVSGEDRDVDFGLEDTGECWDGGGAFPDSCMVYTVRDGTTVLELRPGARTFRLWNVAANCSVVGGESRNVTVEPGVALDLSLDVRCTALPPVTLRVRANAAGSPLPDNYFAYTGTHGECNVSPCVLRWSAGGNSEVRALPGVQEVLLFAPVFCWVTSPNPVLANITVGAVTDVSFEVYCRPPGYVRVRVSASGRNIPAEFYVDSKPCAQGQLWENCFSGAVRTTRAYLSPGLRAGNTIDVGIPSLDSNCRITSANPVRVTPESGVTTDVSFEVACD